MKKIPCMFVIDHIAHEATDAINPKAEFILHEENVVATIKRDGQAMMLDENGNWLTRRAVKPGKKAPTGFVLADNDPNTGISFGWEPVGNSGVAKAFKDAMQHVQEQGITLEPGTFELCGPKIQGNPENLAHHTLFVHGSEVVENFPMMEELRNSENVKATLLPLFTEFKNRGVEGAVLWANGVPAVKIRVKDFPELGGAAR